MEKDDWIKFEFELNEATHKYDENNTIDANDIDATLTRMNACITQAIEASVPSKKNWTPSKGSHLKGQDLCTRQEHKNLATYVHKVAPSPANSVKDGTAKLKKLTSGRETTMTGWRPWLMRWKGQTREETQQRYIKLSK